MNETIKVEGGKGAEKRIERLRKQFEKRREPFRLMADHAREIIGQTFDTEGNGERWQELSDRYRKRKERLMGPGLRILEFTGRLRESLESPTARGSINIIRDTFALIGTKIPYAVYHESNKPRTSNLPRRSFLKMTDEDVSELRGIMLKWAVKRIRTTYQDRPKPVAV